VPEEEYSGERRRLGHIKQKTDRQDAQHILRLLNMISAGLGSELGEPDCPDFSASHSIDEIRPISRFDRWSLRPTQETTAFYFMT